MTKNMRRAKTVGYVALTHTRRSALLLGSAAVPVTLLGGPRALASERDQVINLPTRISKERIDREERKPDASFKEQRIILERVGILGGGLSTIVGIYVQNGDQSDYHLRVYADVTGVGPKLKLAVSQMTGVLRLRSDDKTVLTFDLVLRICSDPVTRRTFRRSRSALRW